MKKEINKDKKFYTVVDMVFYIKKWAFYKINNLLSPLPFTVSPFML